MADKLWTFMEKLKDRTDAGKVAWERTANDDVYQASFPNHAVRIFTRAGEAEFLDYVVQIVNQEGVVVEEASDVDLSKLIAPSPPNYVFQFMKDLHGAARRKAMGVDRALDILIDSLDRDDDDVPF